MKKYIIKSGAEYLAAMGEPPLWSTDPVQATRFKEEQALRYQRSLDQQGINAEIIEVNIAKYGEPIIANKELISLVGTVHRIEVFDKIKNRIKSLWTI